MHIFFLAKDWFYQSSVETDVECSGWEGGGRDGVFILSSWGAESVSRWVSGPGGEWAKYFHW